MVLQTVTATNSLHQVPKTTTKAASTSTHKQEALAD